MAWANYGAICLLAALWVTAGISEFCVMCVVVSVFDLAVWRLARTGAAVSPDSAVGVMPAQTDAVDTVTVRADGWGVRLRTARGESEGPWDDLAACEDHGSSVVLRFGLGDALRMPNDATLEPVYYTARRLVAARQAHDEALQERMARGLSRPEGEEQAERGLSVVEAEQR